MTISTDRRKSKIETLVCRYGPVCWICEERIDLSLPEGHDERVTLDHVVPRTVGGSDRNENLRIAHAICNFTRGRFHERELHGWAA